MVLFRVMTKERAEIVIEGSEKQGSDWLFYAEFRAWNRAILSARPELVRAAPTPTGLADVWFAALGNYEQRSMVR